MIKAKIFCKNMTLHFQLSSPISSSTMHHAMLPGGIPPRPRKSSTVEIMGLLAARVKRPLRSRAVLYALLLLGAVFLIVAKHQGTASAISHIVPHRMANALGVMRWDEQPTLSMESDDAVNQPGFHLLIPASNKGTMGLCKTMLSAAILKYPAPTLINYGRSGNEARPGAYIIRSILEFLNSGVVQESDLVLVVDEGMINPKF